MHCGIGREHQIKGTFLRIILDVKKLRLRRMIFFMCLLGKLLVKPEPS